MNKTPDTVADENEQFLSLIASGLSIRNACLQLQVTRGTFTHRMGADADLREKFIEAKRYALLVKWDEIEDLFDDLDYDLREKVEVTTKAGVKRDIPKYDPKALTALVQARRARVDQIKWAATKLMPRLFGEQMDGETRRPVQLVVDLGEEQPKK